MSNVELVINSISALGAVAAAGIALGIATKDRKDRSKERHAADRAQARLVLVEVRSYYDSPYLYIDIVNHSAQPILNVVLDRVLLRGHEFTWQPRDRSHGVIRMIKRELDEAPLNFCGMFVASDGSKAVVEEFDELGNSRYSAKPDIGLVVATITFTDASGNLWSTDTEGTLTYIGTAD